MPQLPTRPQPAKKLISASMPINISDQERAELEALWRQKAFDRELAIARETRIPEAASRTLNYQLRRFGKFWNSYYAVGRKWTALLPAPSLLTSALSALEDKMSEEAMKS